MHRNFWLIAFAILVFLSMGALALPVTAPDNVGGAIDSGDTAWMLAATGLVLLMTPGLAFFYGGMVRSKNVVSTMLQSFVALGVISVLWVVVGFSLAFGDSLGGVIGNPTTYMWLGGVGVETQAALAPTIPFILFCLFQMKFAIITPALVTGSFAERVRFGPYLVFIALFSLLVYAPLAHWTWHPDGFLRQWGVLDFAGGTVVHMSAGFAALAGVLVVGPRLSDPTTHKPANIPFVILGTGLLWFGWFGFNAGSALGANGSAAQAFLTTNSASASAMLTWLFVTGICGRKPSALGACIGAVVGLVAITPAAGFVTVGASLVIGIVASLTSFYAVHRHSKGGLDDTLDVFPCHGIGGLVGMLLTGVFASSTVADGIQGGAFYGGWGLLLKHGAALLLVSAYSFVMSYGLFKLVNRFLPLRVAPQQETEGLDISQHDEVWSA